MKKRTLLLLGSVILIAFLVWQFWGHKESMVVNLTVPQTAYSIPTIIAIEKGFFKDEGLDVQVNYVKTGKIAMDDLLGGKANFANVVETNIVFAGFNSPQITVLANFEKVYDAAIVARKDKGITSPLDLRGKKIGVVLATTSQVFADRFLRNNGISSDQIEMVNLLPPAMQSGIIEGSGVDAISLWQPYVYNVQKALGDNAVTFTDKTVFTGYMNLVGNNNFIKENPEVARKMLKAYLKAEDFLKNNKAESIAILTKILSMDTTTLESIWDEYEFHISLEKSLLDATKTESMWIINTQKDFAGKKMPDYSTLFDPSVLKEIDESRVKW